MATLLRWKNWLWLLPGLLGGLLTLLIMVVLPPDRTIDGFGEFVFKLLPLLAAVAMIALFPQRASWLHWGLLAAFVLYMGYLDSVFMVHVLDIANTAADGQPIGAQFDAFYRFALFVNAFTILLALIAYRVGGGATVRTLKLGLAGILVLIAGLNDLSFWALYSWPEYGGVRPETFDWASHMIIFTGGPPRLPTVLVFVGIHLLLAVGVMLLPIQRWADRWLQARGGAAQGETAL